MCVFFCVRGRGMLLVMVVIFNRLILLGLVKVSRIVIVLFCLGLVLIIILCGNIVFFVFVWGEID